MAILPRSRVLCWLKPPACLLSWDSGRVTGQLKPLIYYSSTHVRYYRGNRVTLGRGRHALLHHRVRKWTQNRSRLATRSSNRHWPGPVGTVGLCAVRCICHSVPRKTLSSLCCRRPICFHVVALSPDFKTGCKLLRLLKKT